MAGAAPEKTSSSVRHSKVAQAAVAAFTTAAARAAQVRRNNRVMPEQETEKNHESNSPPWKITGESMINLSLHVMDVMGKV